MKISTADIFLKVPKDAAKWVMVYSFPDSEAKLCLQSQNEKSLAVLSSLERQMRNKLIFHATGHFSYSGDGIAVTNRDEVMNILREGTLQLSWQTRLRAQFLSPDKFYFLKDSSEEKIYVFTLRHRSPLNSRQCLSFVCLNNAETMKDNVALSALLSLEEKADIKLSCVPLRNEHNVPHAVNLEKKTFLPVVLPDTVQKNDFQTLFSAAATQGDVMFLPCQGSLLNELQRSSCSFFANRKEYPGEGHIKLILLSGRASVISDEKIDMLKMKPKELLDDICVVPVDTTKRSPFVLTETKDGKFFLLSFCGASPQGPELFVKEVPCTGLPADSLAMIREYCHQQAVDLASDMKYRSEFQAWIKKAEEAEKAKAEAEKAEQLRKIAEIKQSGDSFPQTTDEKVAVYRIIKKGDYKGLLRLCEGKNVNFNVLLYDNPLWFYIIHDPSEVKSEMNGRFIKIIEFMFRNGANPQAKDRKGFFPSYRAAYRNNYEVYKILLKNGLDVSARDPSGRNFLDAFLSRRQYGKELDENMLESLRSMVGPSLITFVKSGDLDGLKSALADNQNMEEINTLDEDGLTVLHHAVRMNNGDICRELMKAGADPNRSGTGGYHKFTPVDLSAYENKMEALRVFWEFRERIPERTWIRSFARAGNMGQSEAFIFLLEQGLDPMAKTEDTPVSPAEEAYNHAKARDMIDHLESKGIAMPLWAACKWGNLRRIQDLIDAGADINKKDGDTDYPITCAVKGNQTKAVKLLIANHCSVNLDQQADNNEKPVRWAAEMNNTEIMALLLQNGGDPNYGKISDIRNESPLFRALKNKNYEMAELLLKAGARTDGYSILWRDDGTYVHKTFFDHFKDDQTAVGLLKQYQK